MLVVPIPPALQAPGGLYHAITDVDLLLHANAGAPYVAIAGCPLGTLDLRTVLQFNPAAPGAPAGPLATTATAPCVAGPPPAVNPMPRPAPPPPAPPGNPPPGNPPPATISERAVAPFGLELKRKGGEVRRLRLTAVPADARVSVRCLRRCGRRGAELSARGRGATVRLKRALRPRSEFEVRVSRPGLVSRYARYRVDRRGRSAARTKAGCLDDRGAVRACPTAG